MKQTLSIQEYESILDSIPFGAFVVNNDWRIQYINKVAKQLLKVNENDVLGRICQQLFQTSACANHCPLAISLQSGKNQYDHRVELRKMDGTPIQLMINTSILRSETGEVIGGIVTFRPIETIEPEENSHYQFCGMIGHTPVMKELFQTVRSLQRSRATVVIQGESGSGKERLARAIHQYSPVSDGPFLALSCGAIPDTLLESELFGHRKGAFTDAKAHHTGYFERASGGTLFLDEIAEASPLLQVKLLRVLEEQKITPVGGEVSIPIKVRVIAASHRNLLEEVHEGRFREDLFYRLSVIQLKIPPLRERVEDIPYLVDAILKRAKTQKETDFVKVSDDAMKFLQSLEWKGNVRELENAISYAIAIGEGPVLTLKHLPKYLFEKQNGKDPIHSSIYLESIQTGVNPLLIALARANHRVNEAAKLLGISRVTFWRRLKTLQQTGKEKSVENLDLSSPSTNPECPI
ncbi:MAG: sigma 54-interacting transcriptional regulator [bacterium]|nr:sigma 54-interacting transcriptional regulator [bacterium]